MTAACLFGLSVAIALPQIDGADVTLRNRLTGNQPDVTTCTLDVGGVQIGVTWHHLPGDVPDEIEITPPPGYVVDRPRVVVPENDETTVRVRAVLMG